MSHSNQLINPQYLQRVPESLNSLSVCLSKKKLDVLLRKDFILLHAVF